MASKDFFHLFWADLPVSEVYNSGNALCFEQPFSRWNEDKQLGESHSKQGYWSSQGTGYSFMKCRKTELAKHVQGTVSDFLLL